MVSIMSLWLPIVLSAVIVFVASSIIHMVLTYHRTDFRQVPSEDQVRDALGKIGIPPGEYMVPFAGSPKRMKEQDFIDKMTRGPVAFLTVMKSGPPSMGSNLALWFLYCVAVSIFAGYIAGRALGTGHRYLEVFRFAGCTAFIGYSVALWQNSIWYKRAWSTTLKQSFDGLVYALLTAGTFGWLWPR